MAWRRERGVEDCGGGSVFGLVAGFVLWALAFAGGFLGAVQYCVPEVPEEGFGGGFLSCLRIVDSSISFISFQVPLPL